VRASALSPLASIALAAALPAGLSTLPLPGAPAVSDDGVKRGEALARTLCVTCHAFSPPEVLPRASWRGEIEKMFLIVEGKGIPGWGAPPSPVALSEDYRKILAYYEHRAPAALPAPETWPAPGQGKLRFERRSVGFKDALTPEPAVANVRLADLNGDGHLEILACDMRQGAVLLAGSQDATLLASVPHPSHVSVADLDRDGRQDLIVADLGEFFPGDHDNGAAYWLRGLPEGGYAARPLGSFPRVADVEAADFDGNGRLDLVVAAFGWWRKGQIAVLLDREAAGANRYERTLVDARPGSVHVSPADLQGDGKQDFVALIAQEHEAVVAFLGDGTGGFRANTLYAAPHPNWGSSGLQLVDLDGDRDLDVLVTNGDMFDDDILKPYHGVQWLENEGGLRFEARPLARLAGAHRAAATDLDGDGDLDVVVSAFTGAAGGEAAVRLPSLVWLEQLEKGHFERHTIAVGRPRYPTIDVGDVDGDGDVDIVAGVFLLQGQSTDWLDVWVNQKSPVAAPHP
jgi:mono/diheme cytochrome c family protein